MIAPIMERTPSDMASTKPPRFMSLRGGNMQAPPRATQAPMHRPMTGFSPTAVAKSTPLKKPPMYIMPRMENTMSTKMGTIRSQMVPRSEMFRPLYSLNGPGGGVVDVALLGHHRGDVRRAFQIDLGLVGDAGERDRLNAEPLGGNAPLGIGPEPRP